jgi:hypothetical protein
MDDIYGLSLWQPWASLWAIQAKKYETRSWATRYRGQIAIHAAAKSIRSILRECFPCGDWEYHPSYKAKTKFLNAVGFALLTPMDKLPLGAIIATAELVECHRMQIDPKTHRIALYDSHGNQKSVSICSEELMFGDWTPGRYAWEIKNVKLLPEPIPYKGAQGLWRIPNAEEILKGVL